METSDNMNEKLHNVTKKDYTHFRVIHCKYDYRQDCIMAILEHNCDFVVHRLKNLFATDNKHLLVSDCDAITNINVIFSHYVPLGMTIELRQFARNIKNIKKINYKIIDNRTVQLQLDRPINVVYYNHNNFLFFNIKSGPKNNIYLEYDVIYVNSNMRDNLLEESGIFIDQPEKI